MFAANVKPVCGVPPSFYINSLYGSELTAVCADVRSVSMLTCAVTLALLLVLQSFFFFKELPLVDSSSNSSSASSAEEHTNSKTSARGHVPMISAAWAIVPLVLGAAYVFSSRAMASTKFEVRRATFAASQLPKNDYIQLEAMDRRMLASASTAIAGSSIVTMGSFVPKTLFN